jgi:hypothetical protein
MNRKFPGLSCPGFSPDSKLLSSEAFPKLTGFWEMLKLAVIPEKEGRNEAVPFPQI